MLERQVVIPSSPSRVWEALTDPVVMRGWFGSQVEWDLRPGGAARFVDDDGTVRRGVIDTVFPGRHLSFRWWKTEGDEGCGASRVTYTLDPDEDGTRLTVTEQPVPVPTGHMMASSATSTLGTAGTWSAWDTRLLSCWARAEAGALVGCRRA